MYVKLVTGKKERERERERERDVLVRLINSINHLNTQCIVISTSLFRMIQ